MFDLDFVSVCQMWLSGLWVLFGGRLVGAVGLRGDCCVVVLVGIKNTRQSVEPLG